MDVSALANLFQFEPNIQAANLFWHLAHLAQQEPTHSRSDLKASISYVVFLLLLFYHLCHLFIIFNYCLDCGIMMVLEDSAVDIKVIDQ